MREGIVMADTMLIAPWIRRFLLDHVVGERNLSLNTQKSYRDMLLQLLPFIAAQVHRPIERLTVPEFSTERIRLFLKEVEGKRRCTVRTRNQRLSAIHALARFIGQHAPEHLQWCAEVRLIPFKKMMDRSITCLDREEIQAILNAPLRSSPQGERDYALLLFLYNSGARVSEAAGLSVQDLDWHARAVQILGKGKKVRTCPLWPATIQVLRPLTAGRTPTERVFLNRNHQSFTRSGIYGLVKRYAAQASHKIPAMAARRIGPHVIRHSTASHLLRAGVDINTIRGWLGHVSLDTTNIYAEIDLETKARALAACAIKDGKRSSKPWRQQPNLMEFLHAL
jgi:site-specific recombinase XerD